MSYDSAVAADSPFHFWKLNGSLADSGSQANALTGTTPNNSGGPVLALDGYATLNVANRLLSTNGEDPFISTFGTTSAENPFSGSYTVVMGLYVPSNSGIHANGYVLTPHNSIPPGALWIDTNGQLNVAGWGTGYQPTGGSWVHIAYTWDGTNLRLYVNGALQAGPHAGQNAGFGSSTIFFGYDGSTNNIAGSVGVSRVAIFTSALSAGTISTLYTDWGTSASSYDTAIAGLSPVNYWKFNGSGTDSGSLANNISLPSGRPATPAVGGPFGDGFESVGAVRAYTAEFYINPSAASITGYLQAQWNAQPVGSIYLNAGVISTWGGGNTAYSPPANTWTHVALAFDGYNTVLYVNGSSQATVTNVYGGLQNLKFSFGEDGSNSNGLSANVGMGRFAWYGYALSASQVLTHYSANSSHALGFPTQATFSNWQLSRYVQTLKNDGATYIYLLDEPSGTVAYDSSGHGYNGTYPGSGVTYQNAALLTGVPSKKAPLFNGVPNGVQCPGTALPTGSQSWSMECWFSTTHLATSAMFLVDMGVWGTNNTSAGLEIRTGVLFGTEFGGGAEPPGYTLSSGATYQAALTYDGTNLRLYVNGTLVGTSPNVTLALGSASPVLAIANAAEAVAHDQFSGNVGFVSVYAGKVLSAAQVYSHYEAGLLAGMGSPSRSRFQTLALGRGQTLRARFANRIPTGLGARDTFRIINGLHAQARLNFVGRAGLTSRARATFPTRHPMGATAADRFYARTLYRGLRLRARFLAVTPNAALGATFAVVPQLAASFRTEAVQLALAVATAARLKASFTREPMSVTPNTAVKSVATVTDSNGSAVSTCSQANVTVTFPDGSTTSLSLGSGVTNTGSGTYTASYTTKGEGLVTEEWSVKDATGTIPGDFKNYYAVSY